MAVWDTCVLIHAIEKSGERWAQIEPYLRDAERGDFTIVIPESVVAELKYLPGLHEDGVKYTEQMKLISDFLLNPYIVRRPIHPGVSELAAEIGHSYNIKRVGDALVVATAVFWKIPVLHTYDGSGKKVKRNTLLAKDGLIPINQTEKLNISIPNYGENTLFNLPDDSDE